MCTIDFIEKIIDLGVDCLKIEGRNRSPEYVATVTKSYRTIIDFICATNKRDNKFKIDLTNLKKELLEKLDTVYHRGHSAGFFLGKPVDEWTKTNGSQATQKKVYIGKVTKYYNKINVAEMLIQGSIKVKIGDSLFFQGPTTGSHEEKIISLEKDHQAITEATGGEKVALKVTVTVRKNDEVYIIKKSAPNQ